jgi:hypothetical protein
VLGVVVAEIEVLWGVVVLHAIDVMNDLSTPKRPTDHFLHDQVMLLPPATGALDNLH